MESGAAQDPDRGGSVTRWFSHLLSWSSKAGAAPRPPETVRYGRHPEQVADLWLPEGPGPYAVVVSIHGGYFQRQYRRDLHDPLSRRLAQAGVGVLNIEYRRARSGGTLTNTTDDVMAAISSLSESRHDVRDQVSVVGHSAGGYLALWAASHPAVDLVIGLAAASDLADCVQGGYDGGSVSAWLGATPAEDPGLYAQADLLARLPTETSTRLVHGSEDRTVPIHQSQRYVDRARQVGDDSTAMRLEGEGHFEVIDPRTPAFDAWLDVILQWAKVAP